MANLGNGINLNFAGRKVLVTGGGRGIGKVTAKTFLSLGATVIVLERDASLIEDLQRELPDIIGLVADISDWAGCAAVLKRHQPIHHLVNNAGIVGNVTNLLGTEEAELQKVLDIDLKGVLGMSQTIAKAMIEHKVEGGTIVNLSSVASKSLFPNAIAYGLCKASVDYLTRVAAFELAPHKIRVNAVRPGVVNTELIAAMPPEQREEVIGPAVKQHVYHPEALDPQTVANAIVFLSSSMSEMTTGSLLSVDAGYELK